MPAALGRGGTPQDIAAAIVFLIFEDSRTGTLGAELYAVDGDSPGEPARA